MHSTPFSLDPLVSINDLRPSNGPRIKIERPDSLQARGLDNDIPKSSITCTLRVQEIIHYGILKLGRDVMILSIFILALDGNKIATAGGTRAFLAHLFHNELRTFANLLRIKPSVIEQDTRLERRKRRTNCERRTKHVQDMTTTHRLTIPGYRPVAPSSVRISGLFKARHTALAATSDGRYFKNWYSCNDLSR